MGRLRTRNELPVGSTVVPDAAQRPLTGGWRTGLKPEVDSSLCVNCLLCWLYCPTRPSSSTARRSPASTSITARAARSAPRCARSTR